MKTILFAIALLMGVGTLFSQRRVALQSNGVTTIFDGSQPYIDAYDAAVNGDTIYLPGGQLSSPSTITKSITVFGVGHHPNYTPVLQKTVVSGFNLSTGADSCHFQGLYIDGGVTLSANIEKVHLKRNRMSGLSVSGSSGGYCDDLLVEENIIQGGVNLRAGRNAVFRNNIVKHYANGIFREVGNNAWVVNNIFCGRGYYSYGNRYMVQDMDDCLVENNIFYNMQNDLNLVLEIGSISNVVFNNNVFQYDPSSDLTNDWMNNYSVADIPAMFTNYVGNDFEYTEDYSLLDPASYVGTNGNQVGIYGGHYPAKLNTIPQNPHFLLKNIAPETNASGELEIEITIEAQDE
jgi:hypothetical protein